MDAKTRFVQDLRTVAQHHKEQARIFDHLADNHEFLLENCSDEKIQEYREKIHLDSRVTVALDSGTL